MNVQSPVSTSHESFIGYTFKRYDVYRPSMTSIFESGGSETA